MILLSVAAFLNIPQTAGTSTVPVDSLTFEVMSSDSTRMDALINGDIDFIYDGVDPSYVDSDSTNLQIVEETQNGYGYLSINTNRWPLNYTAIRVAIALATNKTEIAGYFENAFPIDAALPPANPFSAEGTFDTTYYDADLDGARAVLDEAGFIDIDSDGYREAPNSTAFAVSIVSVDFGPGTTILEHIHSQLDAIGISSTIEYFSIGEYISQLTVYHDYGISFLSASFPILDPTPLYDFTSTSYEWLLLSGLFSNSTYDTTANMLKTEMDKAKIEQYSYDLQEILFEQCPIIPVYSNRLVYAYSQHLTGVTSNALDGISSRWSIMRLHVNDSAYSAVRVAISTDIFSFNPIESTTGPSGVVNNLIWDRLLRIDDNFEMHAGLATNWTLQTYPEDSTLESHELAIVFTIRKGIVWTDGSSVTTEDVAASFNFIAKSWHTTSLNLNDLSRALAISDTKVKVIFNSTSFFNLWYAGTAPILPNATLAQHNPDKINLWDPVPGTSGDLVSSGPYMVSQYEAGSRIMLERNPDYYLDPDELFDTTTSTNTTTPLPDIDILLMGFAGGAIIAVMAVVVIIFKRR